MYCVDVIISYYFFSRRHLNKVGQVDHGDYGAMPRITFFVLDVNISNMSVSADSGYYIDIKYKLAILCGAVYTFHLYK